MTRRPRVPPPLLPSSPIATYTKLLRAIERDIDSGVRAVFERETGVRFDSPADGDGPSLDAQTIAKLRKSLAKLVARATSRSDLISVVRKVADRTDKNAAANLQRQLQTVHGIDVAATPDTAARLEQFRQQQVALIRSAAAEKVERIRRVLDEHRGARVEDVAQRVREQTGVSRSKAELIARDQVMKLNSAVTRDRHVAAGITAYTWSTSGDARVRESHKRLEGRQFAYDDPPVVDESGRRANPGEDYQCRCIAIPAVGDPFATVNEPKPDPSERTPESQRPVIVRDPGVGWNDPAAAASELRDAPVATSREDAGTPAKHTARTMLQDMLDRDGVVVRDRKRSHGETVISIEDKVLNGDGKVNGDHSDETGRVRISRSVHERLVSALAKLGNDERDTLTDDEIGAIRTLTHEVLHGCSPMLRRAYAGTAVDVEEATNEIAARHYTRLAIGVSHHRLDLPDAAAQGLRPRDVEIVRLRDALRSVVKLPAPQLLQMLTEASLALKRHTGAPAGTSDDFIRLFVEGIRWPDELFIGLSGEQLTTQLRRYQNLLLEALGVTTVRSDDAMSILLSEIALVPRNDVTAAMAFYRRKRKAGTLRDEEISMLLRLQDDPEQLARAMDAEHAAEHSP